MNACLFEKRQNMTQVIEVLSTVLGQDDEVVEIDQEIHQRRIEKKLSNAGWKVVK